MRIAFAQICSSTEPTRNLALMRSVLPGAAGADLVMFPEATMAGFQTRASDVAEPLDGPFAQGVRDLAAEFGTTIAVGMFTPAANGRCRNTLLVTGAAGEWSYDKLHLFDAFGFTESDHVEPGDECVLVDVGGVRIGLSICYDLRFPELFKYYAQAGASVVLAPSCWQAGPGKLDQWRLVTRARAIDSTSYILACGQAEPIPTRRRDVHPNAPLGIGHSVAVGPDGVVLYEAGPTAEVFAVDIDPEAVARARAKLPVLANSRFVSDLAH